ncbi:MAG: septum formation initiator family protein [Clostridia bacterium]|nr:septum formation initiator family protein [Clostridia bacterium]
MRKNKDKKTQENTQKHFNWRFAMLGVLFVVFAVYSFFTIINQQAQITTKTDNLDEIQQSIAVQDDKNENLKNAYEIISHLDGSSNLENYQEGLKYIERVARDEYDYAYKGERIFINIAGD